MIKQETDHGKGLVESNAFVLTFPDESEREKKKSKLTGPKNSLQLQHGCCDWVCGFLSF